MARETEILDCHLRSRIGQVEPALLATNDDQVLRDGRKASVLEPQSKVEFRLGIARIKVNAAIVEHLVDDSDAATAATTQLIAALGDGFVGHQPTAFRIVE